MTLTLDTGPGSGPGQLAVYLRVPREEYVSPPRPPVLGVLPVTGTVLADAAEDGANGVTSAGLVPTAASAVSVETDAPGEVTLTVDSTTTSWDWTSRSSVVGMSPDALAGLGVTVVPGQPNTVQIEGSHFTVPGWKVRVP